MYPCSPNPYCSRVNCTIPQNHILYYSMGNKKNDAHVCKHKNKPQPKHFMLVTKMNSEWSTDLFGKCNIIKLSTDNRRSSGTTAWILKGFFKSPIHILKIYKLTSS